MVMLVIFRTIMYNLQFKVNREVAAPASGSRITWENYLRHHRHAESSFAESFLKIPQ
ncbi:hypothetical protein J6590_062707 [Homalodisca vitripennis]|nr:hypothetical protein J6590_062707 [Homalodisca vitripennis]